MQRPLRGQACLETDTNGAVRRVFLDVTQWVVDLVTLDAQTEQDEWTETLTAQHQQSVRAQQGLAVFAATLFETGLAGADLDVPVLTDRLTELQAATRVAVINAEVCIGLNVVHARLDIPRWVDLLSEGGAGCAQQCSSQGDFLGVVHR